MSDLKSEPPTEKKEGSFLSLLSASAPANRPGLPLYISSNNHFGSFPLSSPLAQNAASTDQPEMRRTDFEATNKSISANKSSEKIEEMSAVLKESKKKTISDDFLAHKSEESQESVVAMLKCLAKSIEKIEREFEANKVFSASKTGDAFQEASLKIFKLRELLENSEYADDVAQNKTKKGWLNQWTVKFKHFLSRS